MKFYITIELGNEAMKTQEDVAKSLEQTAEKLRDYECEPYPGEGGRVMDRNGNAVGEWRFGR